MRRYRVEVVHEARAQYEEAVRWLAKNTSKAPVLRRETAEELARLSRHPHVGIEAPKIGLDVQRVLLRRSQYLIYYRVIEAKRVVRILAFWHTSRGSGPSI